MNRPHAWSRDPARDAAVRAAEDGRDRPLPTLEECISGVTETMLENRKGEEMEQGMRTERVVLEFTYDGSIAPHLVIDAARRIAQERDALRARVAELEAAQLSRAVQIWPPGSQDEQKCTERDNRAASGGGEGEPVAWGVFVRGRIDEYAGSEATFIEKEMADEWAGDHRLGGEGIVAPLYRVPPQPRGWLTEDERNAVEFLASLDAPPCVAEARQAARIGKELLARSSPPEVVKPGTQVRYHSMSVEDQRDAQWIAAIAKAGVPVKEVPNG